MDHVEEARAKKAIESLQRSMTSTEIEAVARKVFEEVSVQAVDAVTVLTLLARPISYGFGKDNW